MRLLPSAALALLLPSAAFAKTLRVSAYDDAGRPMDKAALLRYIAPSGPDGRPAPSASGGVYLTDLDGDPVPGRPWWTASSAPAWEWTGADKIRASLPWPVAKDGFSTVLLDNGGAGYADGQAILLNEEIAVTAYRRMRESLKERAALTPPYRPSARATEMAERTRAAIAQATAEPEPARRAALFDKALQAVSYAWQQALSEHGAQIARDSRQRTRLRWGLSLDESLVERVSEFKWIAGKIADSGADWVRLVFKANPDDFTYSRPASFILYDDMVEQLARRKIRVMGSVLDSLLWSPGVTPELYAQRARNLALHYKSRIHSWEVASEPNGNWLGGSTGALSDDSVLAAVEAGASEVKRLDPSMETVATLHWWEGTAGDDRHPFFAWLKWSKARGFGKDIDVIGLSIYPSRHPMGIAFDPAFRELAELFPGKPLLLAGFNFLEGEEFDGYWWLESGNVERAREDLLYLYTATACSIPNGLGGGFFWPTLRQMLKPGKKTTPLYQAYKRALRRLGR